MGVTSLIVKLSRSFAAVSFNSLHFPQMLRTLHRHLKGTKIHKKSIGNLRSWKIDNDWIYGLSVDFSY